MIENMQASCWRQNMKPWTPELQNQLTEYHKWGIVAYFSVLCVCERDAEIIQ